jgi:hypothetical protein
MLIFDVLCCGTLGIHLFEGVINQTDMMKVFLFTSTDTGHDTEKQPNHKTIPLGKSLFSLWPSVVGCVFVWFKTTAQVLSLVLSVALVSC